MFSVFALFVQTDAAEPVIELSSDDEIPPDILQIIPQGPMDFTLASTSQSAMMRLPHLGSSKSKGKAHANGSSHFEVTTNGPKKSAIGSKKSGSMKSPSTQVLALDCIFYISSNVFILAPNVGLIGSALHSCLGDVMPH